MYSLIFWLFWFSLIVFSCRFPIFFWTSAGRLFFISWDRELVSDDLELELDDVDILEVRPVDSDDLLLALNTEDVEVVLPRLELVVDERITLLPTSPSNYNFCWWSFTINQVFLPLPPRFSWTEHFSRASCIFVMVDFLVCEVLVTEYWLLRVWDTDMLTFFRVKDINCDIWSFNRFGNVYTEWWWHGESELPLNSWFSNLALECGVMQGAVGAFACAFKLWPIEWPHVSQWKHWRKFGHKVAHSRDEKSSHDGESKMLLKLLAVQTLSQSLPFTSWHSVSRDITDIKFTLWPLS